MEEDIDDLDNLFEEYEGNEQQPKDTGDEQQPKDAENEAREETSEGVKVPAPKRVIKNPRLKFNADRLCGERGIPILVDYFKDVKFRGKGFEKEDLRRLLAKLEHWTHRLFPSMKFEDSLRQIEKLGKKRPVQTCLRKIRLDMPIVSSDFIHGDEEKDEEQRISDDESAPTDLFDKLIEGTSTAVNISSNPSTPAAEESRGHLLGSSLGSGLTDEQRKRMDYNRMLAAERRRAKLTSFQTLSNITHEDKARTQSESYDAFNKNSSASVINLDQCDDSNKHLEVNYLFHSNERVSSEVSASVSNAEIIEGMKSDDHLTLPKLLDSESSERLKLDDLMDLIEDDEPCQERSDLLQSNVCISREVTTSVVDDDDDEIVGENNREKNLTFSKLSDNENSKRLKLDDLVDLIEYDKSCLPLKDTDTTVCEMAEDEVSNTLSNATNENVQSPNTDVHLDFICHEKNDNTGYDTPVKSCLNKLLDMAEKSETN